MIQAIALPMEVRQAVRDLERPLFAKLRVLLRRVGQRTVRYLRSYTGEYRPAAQEGDPTRPEHPGGWADITGRLRKGYRQSVRQYRARGEIVLALKNDVWYAHILEVRDGFWVLQGVAEPGGPVEVAIRDAIAELAPDMKYTLGR